MSQTIRAAALAQMQQWAAEHKGEVPPGSNLGPFVAMVLAPASLTPPQPYCASAISMAFKMAAQKVGKDMPFPYSPGALNLWRHLRMDGCTVDESEAEPGDLIFWRRGDPQKGLGHVGIVSAGPNDGRVLTVEANRASTVSYFHYNAGEWEHNFVGFARVPG